MDRIEYKRSDC